MVNVFYLDISTLTVDKDFLDINNDRFEYISKINNQNRKKQSYFATKLLEYILEKESVDFSCGFSVENGKWVINSAEVSFSISHSNSLVCVALSKEKVGVDIEKVDKKILLLEKKFPLSEGALLPEDKLLQYTRFWTEREARLKANSNEKANFFTVQDDSNNDYVLCVVSDNKINVNKIIDLT